MNSPENSSSDKHRRSTRKERLKDMIPLTAITVFAYTALRPFDRGQMDIVPPEFLQGHLVDTVAPFAHAYFNRVTYGRDLIANTTASFLAPAALEIGQGITGSGTYDAKDFIAYGVGSAAYYAIERFKSRHRPPAR